MSVAGGQRKRDSGGVEAWINVYAIPRCHPERSVCFAVREACAESKDPVPACSEMNPARLSHDAACRRDRNSLICRCRSRKAGSFDCGWSLRLRRKDQSSLRMTTPDIKRKNGLNHVQKRTPH